MAVSGVVLAGGASRRFGRDKRAEPVDGVPMLRRAVDAVVAVADDVTVVTHPDRPIPDEVALPPGVTVGTDAVLEPSSATDARGVAVSPLGGLLAGLEGARHEVVVVVGADHPWLDPATLTAVATRLAADGDLDAVVADDGRPQPLVAAYRRRVATTVRARLAAGDPRLVGLLDHLAVARVTELPGAARSVRDVDTPDDLTPTVPAARSLGATSVLRVEEDGTARRRDDHLAAEEPLAIALAGVDGVAHEVATTLRTPGHEIDLAVGLLHAEGLLAADEPFTTTAGDVWRDARPDDHLTVHVAREVDPTTLAHRHAVATASCGLCGRATIEQLLARTPPVTGGTPVPWATLVALPERLRDRQATFAVTGGLHATGIADRDGRLLVVREDVGRHNALDAAIGERLRAGDLPLTDRIVVLSGRVGTELVHKAAVAGAPLVVAVGAPSDLAVRTAEAVGVTLVAFVRGRAGNVYTHPERVALDPLAPAPRARAVAARPELRRSAT